MPTPGRDPRFTAGLGLAVLACFTCAAFLAAILVGLVAYSLAPG